MSAIRRARLALVLLLLATGCFSMAVPARALDILVVQWDDLSAEAPLGGPTVFRAHITTGTGTVRVDALVQTPRDPSITVVPAHLSGAAGIWDVDASLVEHILPNTRLTYRFRLTDQSGQQDQSPSGVIDVVDDRFDWQTTSGSIVRLHSYSGGDTFGQRALAIGEDAVAQASSLLGVTETEPIDFFIYSDEKAFRDALGPGVRENVAGTAFSENRTMYAYILPSQVNDDWVDILVTHELTHLVFDTATHNIYHPAPHWLNEGIATYLSEGFSSRWQDTLSLAKATSSLIPLQGMALTFGAGSDRFDLGYAESVSAVDYFVKTYTDAKLWALVRSYAEGLSDDDAFKRATGLDVAGFNAAWMKSLGVSVSPQLGPQPGPTGLLPPEWQGLPPAAPGQTPPPAVRPGTRPNASGGPGVAGAFGSGLTVIALVVIVVAALFAVRLARRRNPPPPAYWPPTSTLPQPPESSLPPWPGPDEPPPSNWSP